MATARIPPPIQSWLQRQVKGATFREITLKRLRELPVAVPPIELQQTFEQRIRCVEVQSARLQRSDAQLDTLFSSLQQLAFRGDL